MGRRQACHLLFWSVTAVGTLFDQVTKRVIEARLSLGAEEPRTLIPGVLGLLRHNNPGALWGLGGDHPALLLVLSFAAIGVILYLFLGARTRQVHTDLALALMLAGALGNLVDRLLFGEVCDFIKLLFWPRYPVFNLADVWLALGVMVMLAGFLFARPEGPASGERPPSSSAAK